VGERFTRTGRRDDISVRRIEKELTTQRTQHHIYGRVIAREAVACLFLSFRVHSAFVFLSFWYVCYTKGRGEKEALSCSLQILLYVQEE